MVFCTRQVQTCPHRGPMSHVELLYPACEMCVCREIVSVERKRTQTSVVFFEANVSGQMITYLYMSVSHLITKFLPLCVFLTVYS